MRLRNRILGLASVLALAACAQQQPAPDTSEADTSAADAEAVRTLVDQFVSAWNAGDHATLGSMVAEDAVLMQPEGPVLEGHEAIMAVISVGYDIALVQQTATVDEVISLGNHVYARGTWNLNPTVEAGADVPAANGMWSVIYKQGTDGGWETWRWMWNQPSAQAAAVE